MTRLPLRRTESLRCCRLYAAHDATARCPVMTRGRAPSDRSMVSSPGKMPRIRACSPAGPSLVTWPVTLPGSWVASTEPEAVIARRECDEPFQGRGRTLATCDRGPGARRTLPVTSLARRSGAPRRARQDELEPAPLPRLAVHIDPAAERD